MGFKRPLRILLVEDDEFFVKALRRALRKASFDCELMVARDGVEGLEILRGLKNVARLHGRLIILLDLRMPRMHGLTFLRELRKDAEMSHHVVFVLSTSDNPTEIEAAYREHVAGYILKDRVGEDYQYLLDILKPYQQSVMAMPET